MSARRACAECGTTEAQTYVVTQLDPDDESTVTEVCRACDDILRLLPLLETWRKADADTRPSTPED